MRVLICGGRHYNDWKRFNALLDAIHAQNGISCIIQGGATGADWLARVWAGNNAVNCQSFPAEWENLDVANCKVKWRQDGKPYNALAGFNRNQEMIEFGEPDLMLAFPGGEGTADMTRRTVAAGVATLRINPLHLDDGDMLVRIEGEAPPPPVEWLLRPDPNKPKQPRRAEPTPTGRYEAVF